MTTWTHSTNRLPKTAGTLAIATLALAGLSLTNSAIARDNVTFSVSVGVPGVVVGASNYYPVYSQPQPVYVQPRPLYVQPPPVYVQPPPVYVQPAPVYYQSAPVIYGYPGLYPYGQVRGHGHGWNKRHGGYYVQPAPGYAPIYYRR